MLLQEFKLHLDKSFIFLSEKKLLLAVSGGIDSMVLLDLMYCLGYEIEVAHCNFKLRGEDSLQDKLFVEKSCKQLKIKFHTIDFNTQEIAEKEKNSIQLVARKIRYNWFNKVCEQENLAYILTAHHLDDAIETFIINLARGTGIKGLMGIPQKNKNIIRPLLNFTKEALKNYALEKNIEWREDTSNQKQTYIRNKIRHQITPHLLTLNSNFHENFRHTQSVLKENQEIIDSYIALIKAIVTKKNGEIIHIFIPEIMSKNPLNTILYSVFSEYGLNSLEEINKLINSETGSIISTKTHNLLKNRDEILVNLKTKEEKKNYFILFKENYIAIDQPIKLELKKSTKQEVDSAVCLDLDCVKLPFNLRKWEKGDYFYPLGMKGKKKVSKFFKDQKLSIFEKNDAWLLCDANDSIIWIVNHRLDERVKITGKTTKILNIKLN